MAIDEEWGSGLVGKKMAGGRYLIVSELATDGRRTLYEAENVELGLRVTLGIVRADGTPSTERLRNGEKLRSLKQPGLVSVLDVGKLDSGDLYVATERAVGTELRKLIAAAPIDQRRALVIVRQVLEALAAAHAAAAIHGDIRPENIIVSTDGRVDTVKVIDFGVATLTGATKSGDARYSAPEFALGAIDARADLYSVGAVLFELLTGHPPFFADNANALRRLHAYAPVQTLAQRAPDRSFIPLLEEIVAKALAKKRDARFQNAGDMIEALDNALQAIDEVAPPEPEPESPRRRKPNDSLLLLAKDLMPAAQATNDAPLVPVNIDRKVPELPWHTRVLAQLRKALGRVRAELGKLDDKLGVRARLAKLDRKHKLLIGAGAAVVLLVLVLVIALSGGDDKPAAKTDVTARAQTYIEQGDAHAKSGDARGALTAYGNAIALAPKLAEQPAVIASLRRLADTPDSALAIAALELVAQRSGSAGRHALAEHASSHPTAEVRQRARNLAMRAGAADRIDRVTSFSLDLEQATSCDQRRAAIAELAKTADQRAVAPLTEAKAHKCVERDASEAIQRVTAAAAKSR